MDPKIATLPQDIPLGTGRRARIHPAGDAAFALLETARGTPFQSALWLRAWLGDPDEARAFRLIEITDAAGATILLPVTLRRRGGLVVAVKPGGAHASFMTAPVLAEPVAAQQGEFAAALKIIARAGGIDAFLLADCPQGWNGMRNPLAALPRIRAPEPGHCLTLDGAGETVLARLSDREARKKLRYKKGKLAAIGRLDAGWASPAEAPALISTFLDWKADHFRKQGLADSFADNDIRQFLVRAVAGDNPAIRLYRLAIENRPVAIMGLATAGDHASGMFTAYDPSPDINRYSPGEVMIAELIDTLASAGMKGFDLGIGDARYKRHYCPEILPLFDCALATGERGHLAVAIWRAGRRLKAIVKRRPRLLAMARKAKSWLGG